MTAKQITAKVVHLIETYAFTKKTEVTRTSGCYVVSFSTTTTSTRASSMITRLNLIMHAVSTPTKKVIVKKSLAQECWPIDRSALALWNIEILIPVKDSAKWPAT